MKKLIIATLLITAFSSALADDTSSSTKSTNSASIGAGVSTGDGPIAVGMGLGYSVNTVNSELSSKNTVNVTTEGNNSTNNAKSNATSNSGSNTLTQSNAGNNSTNTTSQTNTGNNSTNTSTGNSTTVFGDTYQAPRIPVSTAWASPLVASNGTCMGSTSGGAQGAGFGFSVGSTWTDKGCNRRYNAQMLYLLGSRYAAIALMCQDESVKQAMATAGTPCE